MYNTNATNFRKNLYSMLEQTVKFGEPLNISTKEGNAVVLSEEDYNGLLETANINSNPPLRAKIIEGLAIPIEDCMTENEVEW